MQMKIRTGETQTFDVKATNGVTSFSIQIVQQSFLGGNREFSTTPQWWGGAGAFHLVGLVHIRDAGKSKIDYVLHSRESSLLVVFVVSVYGIHCVG